MTRSDVDGPSLLPAGQVERIRSGLLAWFDANARSLPWRKTRDPYAVLVSEVMLQQTQVDRVVPYYERFLGRFPTVQELAAAATSDVIRIWAGLGYNRRAVNLQRAAQAVVNQFGGVFPSDPEQLRKLPGVGRYTAGAIAAFAFEQDVAFLDTNMRRVVERVVFGAEGASEPQLLHAAEQLVPPGNGWTWNQALIEFGALQCTARLPACIVCPLRESCTAYPTMQAVLQTRRAKRATTEPKPFESTSRFYRGRIIEALRELPAEDRTGVALDELGVSVRQGFTANDLPWLRGLVDGLQRDGLAVIAEESGSYDTGTESGAPSVRVRLP